MASGQIKKMGFQWFGMDGDLRFCDRGMPEAPSG